MKPLLAILAIASLVSPALAGETLTLPDLEGKPIAPLETAGKRAAVVFFVSPYCPTSNTFGPEMNAIVRDFGGDFVFRFVHSDTTVTEADRKQHATMMEFTEPVLTDAAQKLAKQLGAKTTPEVVVVSPDGETVYQGRINDLYLGPTRRQREIKTHDLRDALTALRDGKPVANPRTEAMGCGIVFLP
jgi:protein-disulfide isomerase